MPNSARPKDAVEFLCRSAANGQKRCPISTVVGHGQNGLKRLITIRFPTPTRQFSRAKTQLSAVDSGIGEVLTRAGEAHFHEVITAGGLRNLRRAAETPFNMVLEARP